MPDNTIIVYNTDHIVGEEIARLGVAAGLNLIGLADSACDGEPWTRGVSWRSKEIENLEPAYALVVVGRPGNFTRLCEHALDRGIKRVILVEVNPLRALREVEGATVTLAPGPVASKRFEESDIELSETPDVLPIETLSMAALRCALEDERSGLYGPDEVAVIGDALMLQ